MKLTWRYKITIVISAAALGLVLIGVASFGCLQWINSDKIVSGLTVAGLKIGGLKIAEAKKFLATSFDEFSQQKITFVFDGKKWQFSPAELGFSFNSEETFNQATRWGHRSNIFLGIKEQLGSLLRGKEFSAVLNFDLEQFNQTLSKFAPLIEEPPQNAKLTYEQKKNDFAILAETPGLMIDREQLKVKLTANLSQLSDRPVKLILITASPQVTAQDLEAVKVQAQELIVQAPYFIKAGYLTWPIDKEELAQWISVVSASGSDNLTLSQDEIKDFLSQIAPTINRPPINAKLTYEDNKIKVTVTSQIGRELNLQANAEKISEEIIQGNKEIELVFDDLEPEVSNQNINELGLTSFLAQGESNFAGSPKNRVFNINLGASILNGLLIKPNQEFSFDQAIGAVEEKNGWLPELVIKNKQTIPEAGGGICQISTTLFRAALKAGLKITERHPHAYPVRYYQPTGFDATVYPPAPDLKFINDTPNYILLQSKIEGTKLIFEVYGTSDGRQVKIKGPTITQSNPDGSLKTILTQEIWRDGALERQDIFRSSYNSPNLYPVATSTPANWFFQFLQLWF